MKIFNFISNNRIFSRKLSAILLPLVALSVLLLACSTPSDSDNTIAKTKTKVTLTPSSAPLNAVKDTKVGTEKKITITKKPTGATGKWSISPKLPDGLVLTGKENADTATLEGAPKEISEKKKYTVTFTGSGDYGSASMTIDVQVAVAKVVTLTPSSTILNAVKDTKVGTEKKITITKKPAGATGKWSISPKLPDGLVLTGKENADTATLEGAPKEISEKKKYTVTFTGSGDFGSASTTIDVQVAVAKVVTLTPSSTILNAVKDTKVGTEKKITITKKPAGATGKWSISPKLPDGLVLTGKENADTATLEGAPKEISEKKKYTVTFTGSGDFGSASTTIDVQVIKVGVTLIAPAKLSATKDARITPTSAIVKNPLNATGEFSANLPAGLSINGDTGIITGAPERTSTNTYDITFKGSGDYGNAQTTIEIEVGVLGVTLTQPTKLSATTGKEINPGTPIVKSPAVATGEFSVVEKTLPDGLEIDGATGAIKGTPKAVSSSQTYKIKFTGNDKYASATTTIEIEVIALPALTLTATEDDLVVNKGTPITAIEIKTSPQEATGTWSISTTPNLASTGGLTFTGNPNTHTATISGKPTQKTAKQAYTVTFNYTGAAGKYANATATKIIHITVNEIAVAINDFTLNVLQGTVIPNTKISTTHTAGTWTIQIKDKSLDLNTLPANLSFNTSTGVISGTPNAPTVTKDSIDTYVVTFTGTGAFGDATKDVTIGVYKYQPTNPAKLIEHIEDEIKSVANGGQGVSADLNLIDTSAITYMGYLFNESTVVGVDRKTFTGDISKWDVSRVTTMASMFRGSSFDNDISGWDVSAVKDMSSTFQSSSFNQDISSWDVSAVTTMGNMFQDAASFNQNLNLWTDKIGNVRIMYAMFFKATKFSNKGVKMTWDLTGKDTRFMFNRSAINNNHKPTGLPVE